MEKPRRTWMPASWKFLIFQNPNGPRSTGSAWTCSWKPRFGTKPTTNWWAGAREDGWMLKRCHPFDVSCMGVKKSQGSFFFLVWGLFIVDGGGCSPVSQGLINSGKPWNPLFVFEHLFRLTSLTTRWFQSLRFQRDDSIWRADGVDFLDGTSRTRDTGDLLFFGGLWWKPKMYQGSQGLKELDNQEQLQVQVWPKKQPWNLGFAR